MKLLLSSAAMSVLLLASPVLAADLVAEAADAPSMGGGDWTGLYIGGHAGYGMGQAADSLECPVLGTEILGEPDTPIFDQTTFGSITAYTFPALDILAACAGDPEMTYYFVDAEYSGGMGFATSQSGDLFSDNFPEYGTELLDPLDGIDGWSVGAQIGYLYQTGQIVMGAEVNASLSSLHDTASYGLALGGPILGAPAAPSAGPGIPFGILLTDDQELSIGWTASAVGRLGVAISDGILLSANAGLALAQVSFSETPPFIGVTWSDEQVAAGWTAGAQADIKITDNISLFGSYNYSEFNDVGFDATVSPGLFYMGPGGSQSGAAEYDLTIQTIKTGFNYHFN